MLQATTNEYSRKNIGNGIRKSADLFTAEFEINDVRARSVLTKGQTQDEISQVAGASISTRGRFISLAEKRSGGAINDRPLYLFIQGNTKESVDMAVQKIEEIIQMDNASSFRGFAPPPNSVAVSAATALPNTPATPNSTCIEKIFIGLDHAPPSFDLRSRLIGSGGANLNYIRTETGAMATLRGRGSLFVDPMMGIESPEPIHLYIEHLRYEGLQAAKQLARNLIETLQQELIQFQQMNPPIQFSAQTTVVQQPHIYTQHTMTQPPPIMTVPPPQPPPQTQSLIQTHQVPMQIHHGAQSLVQIQSGGQPTISLPPPGLPIPIKTMIPTAASATAPLHLSQPPPSLHLQHAPPAAPTQIVVNQSMPIPIKTMVPMQSTPQTNYQYQYIHTATAGTEAASVQQAAGPGAVTIQHIYQTPHPSIPPQHVQSIVQPVNGPATSYSAQQQPQQQYITVQGNTYMVPPPNMIQTTAQAQLPPPTTLSIIYSSHPPPQMLQQPPNYSMAQAMPASSHQLITVQQPPPGIPSSTTDVKLEEKQDECGNKLEDFNDGQQRSMAQTIVSTMTAPPPIMSVPPPPTVQHIIGNPSYATTPMQHIYGQVPVSMSHAGGPVHMMPPVSGVPPPPPVHHQPQQQQQFVINQPGWPHSMASVSSHQQQSMHLSQPTLHAAHPMEYRSGSGGTTYQQIQHPIMTASTFNNTSMGMPVQYPGMPQPPPALPQPVPFPMQPLDTNTNLMRTGQKRKMCDGGGDNVNLPNKNGHGGDMMNNRHIRMASGGPYAGQDFVTATSTMGPSRATTTSNTNSNDLNQDNYAVPTTTTGHRSDDRNLGVNQMAMQHGDMGEPNCGHAIEPSGEDGAYQNSGGPHEHPGLVNAKGPAGQMSMIRCNIMGKPPPPLPHMARGGVDGPPPILTSQQQPQRYSNQW